MSVRLAPVSHRKRVDGRTKQARRVQTLIAGYREHLADAYGIDLDHDVAMRATVLRLSELECLTEGMRARALRGEPVDLTVLTRLEGLIKRLRKSIGLDSPPV